MAIEGELTVRLDWNGRAVSGVGIRSTRPFAIARMLAGKTTASAAATVPMLFAVCNGAQRAAAASALLAAGATDIDAAPARHENGVALETVGEYFWRLLIDWPQAMGGVPNATPVAAVRQRIAAAAETADRGDSALNDALALREVGAELSRIAAQSIYGISPAAWLEIATLPALDAWIARGATECATLLGTMLADMPTLGRSTVGLMPAPRGETLLAAVLPALDHDPDYACAPTWNGLPVETGVLARVQGHPLVAALREGGGNTAPLRFVARLVDLAWVLTELTGASSGDGARAWVQAFPLGEGDGLAAVQTARGLLMHRVHVDGGRVADYRIVAPTEWNFHPAGALAEGLTGLVADSRTVLLQQARLAVQALDPCVACRIELADA